MQFKSLLALLATSLTLVSAQDAGADQADITTTSTQTMTRTVTITECNPTATNCPGRTSTLTETSTTWTFPLSNSTSSTATAGPTAGISSSFIVPSASSKPTKSDEGETTPGETQPPASLPTGAAAGLFVQPMVLLGAVGAGLALLA